MAAFVKWNGFNVRVEHGNGGGNLRLSLFSFLSVSPELIWLLTIATIDNYTALLLFPPRALFIYIYLLGAFLSIFPSSVRLLLY